MVKKPDANLFTHETGLDKLEVVQVVFANRRQFLLDWRPQSAI